MNKNHYETVEAVLQDHPDKCADFQQTAEDALMQVSEAFKAD